MDEKVINNVISQYAIEQANLRVQLETLRAEYAKTKEQLEKYEQKEGE